MPFCTSCGEPIQPDASFCGHCGKKQEITSKVFANPVPETQAPTDQPSVKELDDSAPDVVPPVATRSAVPPHLAPPPESQHATPTRPTAQPRKNAKHGRGGLTFFGVLLAFAWLAYSSGFMGAVLAPSSTYQMDFNAFINRADWISFGLMLGVPFTIARLRAVLDLVLIPLQFIRFAIPPMVLIGMGLIAPFAVAWWFYNVGGYRNYSFMHMCLIFGPLISYAILRTPERYSR